MAKGIYVIDIAWECYMAYTVTSPRGWSPKGEWLY